MNDLDCVNFSTINMKLMELSDKTSTAYLVPK